MKAFIYVAMLGMILGGCAGPASNGPAAGGQPTTQDQPQAARTLVVVTRAEPPSLSGKPFRQLGLTPDLSNRMFNASFTVKNDAGLPVPYLAANVPQLNTDTWRVFPDG